MTTDQALAQRLSCCDGYLVRVGRVVYRMENDRIDTVGVERLTLNGNREPAAVESFDAGDGSHVYGGMLERYFLSKEAARTVALQKHLDAIAALSDTKG